VNRSGTTHGTTILAVRKDGFVTFASDGLIVWGNTPLATRREKIRMLDGPTLFAASGKTGSSEVLAEIIRKHQPDWKKAARAAFGKVEDSVGLLAPVNGTIAVLTPHDGALVETEQDVVAIGSGGDLAWGYAEALLKSNPAWRPERIAQLAVEFAASRCIYTSPNVTMRSVRCVAPDS